MPTYEYQCDSCGHQFEKFQSITAKPIRKCPKCGKQKVRRLIGAGAGLKFKGNAFYKTDYRSESYRKDAEKEKPKPDSGKGSGKGSDKGSGKSDKTDKPEGKKPSEG